MEVRCVTEDFMRPICLVTLSSSFRSMYWVIREAELMMALRGVLNSCEAMETNFDFNSLSSRSRSNALRASSSAFLRSNTCSSRALMVTLRSSVRDCTFFSSSEAYTSNCSSLRLSASSYFLRSVISLTKAITSISSSTFV